MRHRATQHGIRADAAEILSQFEKWLTSYSVRTPIVPFECCHGSWF
jgi:hypothetical protein